MGLENENDGLVVQRYGLQRQKPSRAEQVTRKSNFYSFFFFFYMALFFLRNFSEKWWFLLHSQSTSYSECYNIKCNCQLVSEDR